MAELFVGLENNQKILIPTSSEARSGNPLGSFLLVYGNTVPIGYLPLETLFDENQYPALYAMLGTNKTPDTPFDLGADWNNSIDISSSFVNNSWTVTENGWIAGTFVQSLNTVNDNYMKINGKQVAHSRNISNYASWGNVQVRINKGDVVTFTTTNFEGIGEGNFTSIKFVPFKKYAHVVIKATSGLEETQQDYVLQSLLEADSYSTEEVATGKKWIDGKMIYRKVCLNCTTSGSADSWNNLGVTISGIDKIISHTAINPTDNVSCNLFLLKALSNGTIQYWCWSAIPMNNGLTTTFILEYTKAD